MKNKPKSNTVHIRDLLKEHLSGVDVFVKYRLPSGKVVEQKTTVLLYPEFMHQLHINKCEIVNVSDKGGE